MNEQKYYFWLGWSYWLLPDPNACMLCEIDRSGFTIHDASEPIHIEWEQVFKVVLLESKPIFPWQSPGAAVEIFITMDAKVRRIYLSTANPMNSAFLHHYQENKALFSVMEAFANHRSTAVHPNPYFRALERVGKPDYFLLVNWDPTVSPKEYRKHPVIQNAILRYQKRGFLWTYWLVTIFLAFGSFWILREGGKDELDAIAVLGVIWLVLTALIIWIVYFANRDLSK